MNKQQFISELRERLTGLPDEELQERLDFYSEMIDDRIDEGLSEDAAVADIGSVDETVGRILAEIPLSTLVKDKITPKRRLKGWEIALIIIGSPIWVSLLVSAISIVFSLYASIWAVIVSLWAVFGSVAACSVVAAVGVGLIIGGKALSGLALIGVGLLCAGLSIFLFFGCKAITDGVAGLTKKCGIALKKRFAKEGV